MAELSLQAVVGRGYKDFWRCKTRYRVCKGSRASKKSKTTALNTIVRMMQYPKANTLYMRRTFATIRDSCYSDLLWAIDKLGVNELWQGKVNPLELRYIPTGQRILFRGFDNPLKITSISVPTGVLCWVVIEEAFEVSDEDAFNKLDLSIRGEVGDGLFKQITLLLNPWSENWWGRARFFDVSDPDISAYTTTFRCNEWLDAADLAVFEKMRINNPRRFRIEGDAEWGIAEGLIYENVEQSDFILTNLLRRTDIKAAYGLDFGFTDPTAFIACLIDEKNSKIYIFDEVYETGLTNQKLGAILIDKGYGSVKITADSADPKAIQELCDMGLRVYPSRKGPDSVLHGIQLIQNYKIIVHPKCAHFWREINNYCWQRDKNGKLVEKPEHDYSHSMDAMRYCCSMVLRGPTFSFD